MTSLPFIPPTNPSVEDCWRGVVLYGKNTASYKFALATALLELRPESGQLLKLVGMKCVRFERLTRSDALFNHSKRTIVGAEADVTQVPTFD